MSDMTSLETAVMDELLSGTDEVIVSLRNQYNFAVVKSREMTKVGFFLYFDFIKPIVRLRNLNPTSFGDVAADIDGLEFGAGFVLHVRSGALDFLEGYSFEEEWPVETSNFTLSKIKQLEKGTKVALDALRA